jgi:hypothetical protein
MNRNKPLIMIIAGVFSFLLCVNVNFGWIRSNLGGTGYEEPLSGTQSIGESFSIEDYIVLGASYYLKAKTDVQKLLDQFELQDLEGVDTQEMTQTINSAVENMRNAVDAYRKLVDKAKTTPYNNTVISKLKNIDYTTFRITHNLNRTIFDIVADYLEEGNITGVFQWSYAKDLEIYNLMIGIQSDVDQGKLPQVSQMWDLNEAFAQSTLFGSYLARVFFSIN